MELAKCLKEKMRKEFMRKEFKIACLLLSVLLWEVPNGETSNIQIPQSSLYNYHNSLYLQDDFLTGGQASAAIGALGWTSSGTVLVTAGNTNNPGLVRLETGAVSGTVGRLIFNGSNVVSSSLNQITTWIARLNTNDANTTIRVGFASGSGTNPPTDGIYFEKLDGDTNWFCVTRNTGVETRTDSTVAVNTLFNTFVSIKNGSNVVFLLNNVQVCTSSTNIPTIEGSMAVQIVNSAAANKTVTIDYAEFILTGISR